MTAGAVAGLVAAHGHDMDTAGDERLGGATDDAVLAAAGREQRLLITLDRRFGDIRRYPPGTHGGILVLRLDHQSVLGVHVAMENLLGAGDLAALAGTVPAAQRGLLRVRRS